MWPRPYTQQQSQGRSARQSPSWGDSGPRPQRPQRPFGGPQRGPSGFGQPQRQDYEQTSQSGSGGFAGQPPSRGGFGGGWEQGGYSPRSNYGRSYQRPAPQWPQDEPTDGGWSPEPSFAPEPRWGRSYQRPAPPPQQMPDMSTQPNWQGNSQQGFRSMDSSEAAPDYGRGQATLMGPDPSMGHPFSPFRQKSQQVPQAPMSRGGGPMFDPDQAASMEAAQRSQMDQFGGPATSISQLTQRDEPSGYDSGYPTAPAPSKRSFASRRYARPAFESPGFAF